jgi:glycosyltransferase involved in cell wall biosynthesis
MSERVQPHVMYLVTSSGVGGAERQVRDLALAFQHRGWRVTVVSMLPLEPMIGDLAALGIRTETLGMSRGIPDPRALVRLVRLIKATRPDVLHGHMVHANLLARVSRLAARVPVVVSTMHNQDEGGQWRYVAYRLTDRLTDVTTTVSPLALEAAVQRRAVARDRIRVVPNGVDLSVYRPSGTDRRATRDELRLGEAFVWLTVGRLTAAKAQDRLIDAFGALASRYPEAVVLMAGDGELRQELLAQIERRGLEDRVKLLGIRDDLPILMRAVDGFVLSSLWEGLPMVLLEASASGLPIVATDVGGSRDAVLDGVTGFVIPPDDVPALAGAMDRMMSLPEAERVSMGESGRRHAEERFSLPTVAGEWERIYRSRGGPFGTGGAAGSPT